MSVRDLTGLLSRLVGVDLMRGKVVSLLGKSEENPDTIGR
jgi:hypothetical protein